jgi:prepilin-type processing-associated H-X9-DG protein
MLFQKAGELGTMNAFQNRQGSRAFTVLELLVVVVVVFVITGLILPTYVRPRPGCSLRINCVNNLKQVGLAFRLWGDDNNDTYPMHFYTNQTGGLLFADATNGFRYFQAMSNELSTPKILVCPADTRIPATNFATDFSGAHLSYFVGLEAEIARPGAFLSGDRNITNGQKPINGMLEAQTNQNIGWTSELHNEAGNILMADGSVQQLTIHGLRACLTNTGLATNRLLLPP